MSGLLWSILGVIVLVMGWIVSMRSSAKKPIEALSYVGAFLTVFICVVGLVVFVLPFAYEGLVQDALPTFWGPVLNATGDDLVEAAYTAADYVNYNGVSDRIDNRDYSVEVTDGAAAVEAQNLVAPVSPVELAPAQTVTTLGEPELRYTVQRGDTLKAIGDQHGVEVARLVALNGISDPNWIGVGDELLIKEAVVVEATAIRPTAAATVPTVMPMPTATPRPDFSREFAALEQAKIEGNRVTGLNLVREVLERDPGNLQGQVYRDELRAANEILAQWTNLNPQETAGVVSALTGFSFRVLEVETAFLKTKGEEVMTLVCNSPGWMNGEKVVVSRLVGANLGFHEVDDTGKVGR